jgi:large subunit ribosomal protein L3
MKFILGKKLSMTQVWNDDKVVAVTAVLAGPCVVTQVKTKAKDGYEAVQLAYGERKAKNINKPQLGHVKNLDIKPAHLREFRVDNPDTFKVGDVVSVETFVSGDPINVTGTSKGKGFAGVVKRHHFHGFRKTHGNKDQERMPGSIGPKGPAHVFKGMKMGGRMGGDRVTTTNLEVVSVDVEKNIIYVKGAIPGAINGLVVIAGKGDIQLNLKKSAAKEIAPEVVNEVAPEAAAEIAPEVKEEAKEEVKEEVKTEENKA